MTRPDAPQLSELFMGFAKVSISGFGGVLPFARHMLVEEKRWLEEREFADLFTFCQFIPGANIVNLAVCLGRRFHGPVGAVVALAGMLLPPTVVILLLGIFYAQFRSSPLMQGIFRGLGAAAAGLVLTTAIKMARSLVGPAQYIFAALSFAAIAGLRIPLLHVLGALAPISIAYHWYWIRRR